MGSLRRVTVQALLSSKVRRLILCHDTLSNDGILVEWLRVVLDEAHHCKSRNSKTARAVYALKARRRWAVTGTPSMKNSPLLKSRIFI
jgi:SNF2 family DNA or RNA helicase